MALVAIAGRGKQSAEFAFAALPTETEQGKRVVAAGIKATVQDVRGCIVVRELSRDGAQTQAKLVSDTDQTVTNEFPSAAARKLVQRVGAGTPLDHSSSFNP